MSIDDILDMLDDVLDKAWSLPLSGGRCVVDVEKLEELIDDIRLNMPTEIKQARAIVADRGEIIAAARREAEAMIRKAEERVRTMVANEEIVKASQERANEILSSAQMKSREMKTAANDYADNLMKNMEEMLIENINNVKSTRQALKTVRKQ